MGHASEKMIEVSERGWEDVEGSICLTHIEDLFLAASIGEPTENECSFCGRSSASDGAIAVQLQNLMVPFMETFWQFYTRLDDAPRFDGQFAGTTDTESAVGELAEVAFSSDVLDEVAAAICSAISDLEVGTWGASMDHEGLRLLWEEFATTVKHTSRFVMPATEVTRGTISPADRVLRFLGTLEVYASDESGLIDILERGSSIYRARTISALPSTYSSDPSRFPYSARGLGPAPKMAASANRMSPAGIPMFYGATSSNTAVAEIAAHSPADYAVVGKFIALRPLRVLNLAAIPALPSIFDMKRRDDYYALTFLKEFAAHVSAPVIPDGREHISYVPTQVITEYVRWQIEPPLDGIAFQSSQGAEGLNYVLFMDSSGVIDGSESISESLFEQLVVDMDASQTPLLELQGQEVQIVALTRSVATHVVQTRSGGRWVTET